MSARNLSAKRSLPFDTANMAKHSVKQKMSDMENLPRDYTPLNRGSMRGLGGMFTPRIQKQRSSSREVVDNSRLKSKSPEDAGKTPGRDASPIQ